MLKMASWWHAMAKWKETHGMTHAARPEYDKSIERTLKRHFSEHQTVSFENCSVADWEIEEVGQGRLSIHPCPQARPDAHPRPVECPTTSPP